MTAAVAATPVQGVNGQRQRLKSPDGDGTLTAPIYGPCPSQWAANASSSALLVWIDPTDHLGVLQCVAGLRCIAVDDDFAFVKHERSQDAP